MSGPYPSRDDLRRTLSQNFLVGRRAVAWFLSTAELARDDFVVEVGAGYGALTTRIAPHVRQVLAYELDRSLAPSLQARVKDLINVTIVYENFLEASVPVEPFKLVGNIPFGVTSAVVDWAIAARTLTTATLITQLEYAKKRTGAYGRWSKLTVITWPVVAWKLRGAIARTNFRPPPRVDAGILHLVRRSVPLLPQEQIPRWNDLVELGFTGVGGSLFASLCRGCPQTRVARAFDEAGTPRDTVVGFVPPEQWLVIFNSLTGSDRRST